LDYLHKGGRCSGLEAIGARLLGIKPCIEVSNGKMQIGKKYRGRFDLCLKQYIEDKLSDRRYIDDRRAFITHSMCTEQTVAQVREAISSLGYFQDIIETCAGCTISGHCGPNTLGVIFLRNEKP